MLEIRPNSPERIARSMAPKCSSDSPDSPALATAQPSSLAVGDA
jgi:hypothetical protein